MASRYLTTFSLPRRLPAASLLDLQQEFNRFVESAFGDMNGYAPAAAGGLVQAPRLDVRESGNEICVSAELPGVQASDLDVRLDNDVLTISGEKKSESDRDQSNYHMMERSYGRFQRSVQLPFAPRADQVQAHFQDGVLTLHIPKQAQQEQSRRIEVKSGGHAGSQPRVADAQSQQQPQAMSQQASQPGQSGAMQGAQGSGQAGGSGTPPTTH